MLYKGSLTEEKFLLDSYLYVSRWILVYATQIRTLWLKQSGADRYGYMVTLFHLQTKNPLIPRWHQAYKTHSQVLAGELKTLYRFLGGNGMGIDYSFLCIKYHFLIVKNTIFSKGAFKFNCCLRLLYCS